METFIFDYVGKQLGNDIDVCISYEIVEQLYGLNFEEFQEIANNYSYSYGYNHTITKDNISFIKRDRISKTKN